jgi:hypothetical protein
MHDDYSQPTHTDFAVWELWLHGRMEILSANTCILVCIPEDAVYSK